MCEMVSLSQGRSRIRAERQNVRGKISPMPPVPQPLHYRAFAAGDADLVQGWLTAVGLGVPLSIVDTPWAERLIQDPNIGCWVAMSAGRSMGFFRVDQGPNSESEITLIVAPEERRRGVGTQLVHRALEVARSRGMRVVRAVVQRENRIALAFFRAVGFELDGGNTPGNMHLRRILHGSKSQSPLEIQP